jgi:hypothetical protein
MWLYVESKKSNSESTVKINIFLVSQILEQCVALVWFMKDCDYSGLNRSFLAHSSARTYKTGQ